MITASYQYLVDWDNDGLFAHAHSDISAYVLVSEWRSGSPQGSPHPGVAGTLTISLDNSTSIFSSFYTSSPLYGSIRPGLAVKVLMNSGAGATVQWHGYLQAINPSVGFHKSVATADLTAYGVLSKFTEAEVDIALQTDITTGGAIDDILDAYGLAAGARSIETGQSTLSKWWLRPGTNLLQALHDLENEELGRIREGKDGKLIFEDRSHVFTATRSLNVQSTFGTGTLNIWNLRQDDPINSIFNLARGEVRTFNKSEEIVLVVVSDVPNNLGGVPVIIPASSSKTVYIEYPTPGTQQQHIGVNEWTTVDYTANTAANGSGSDITSDVSAVKTSLGSRQKIVFTNANGSAAHLIVFRAWGYAIVETDPIPIVAEGTVSQAKYGKRQYPYQSQWITSEVSGQAKLAHLVTRYADPTPRIVFDVRANYNSAHLAEVQAREVSDRVHVTAGSDFGLYIDADFIIDQIIHRVDESRLHVMTVVCTKAPTDQLGSSGTAYTSKTIDVDTPAIIKTNYESLISQTLLVETFEAANVLDYWTVYAASTLPGTPTIVAGNGVTGGNVLHAVGGVGRALDTVRIPFNPSWLYKLTIKVRRTATTDAANQKFYLGLRCLDTSKVTISSTRYPTPMSAIDMAGWTINEWQDIVAWMKGTSASPSGGASPIDPYEAQLLTAYFSPVVILNYGNGAGTNEGEVDCIKIEMFDEVAQSRIYAGLNSDGTVADDMVEADAVVAENIYNYHFDSNALGASSGDIATDEWHYEHDAPESSSPALKGDFSAATAYVATDIVDVGSWWKSVWAGGKYLYASAPKGWVSNSSGLPWYFLLGVDVNTSDALSHSVEQVYATPPSTPPVAYILTIKLANTTPANNTAALIQAYIRALGASLTIGDAEFDMTGFVVTENAAYAAARPIIAASANYSTFADKSYTCIQANQYNYFPPESAAYWTEGAEVISEWPGDYTWEELDLSDFETGGNPEYTGSSEGVPAGARAVTLMVEVVGGSSASTLYFRRNGWSGKYKTAALYTPAGETKIHTGVFVELDENRKIEVMFLSGSFDATAKIIVMFWHT